MSTKEKIIEFMTEKAYKPMLKQELARVFSLEKEEEEELFKILDSMEESGQIIRTDKDRYGVPEKMNLVAGTLQGHQRGFGFVIPDNNEIQDIFIPASDLNGALHGDKVMAKLISRGENGRKQEGEIVRILERANNRIVGTFESSKNFGFVISDDKRISMDVFVSKSEINGAKTNDKVVVEITKWPDKRRNPEGRIIEVLGHKNDVGTDILSIIRNYDLSEEFPDNVINEANNIPEDISSYDLSQRIDLRDKTIFTIDGADAKDLDDAVSIDKLNNGNYKLGVHIADVTHYVREKNPLDKEALKRGTSVYLVDRVIPMLPKKLSNGVCSLHPNVSRLTLSVFMEIDKTGKVIDHKVAESIIESKERLTYTDVSDLLENNDEDIKKRYKHIEKDLRVMEELCNILTKKREKRGAIDFDFDEAKIILDEEGKPIDVKKYERRIANRMIEEFMLVCNETVAEYMYWTDIPFVYRVHEEPNEEKINEFNKFIHNFGYHLKGSNDIHPKELQSLLEKIEGTREETVINTLMLRSLKKAKYSHESLGHFGLATQYYCHFTSPIRRYPDLQIHRIIKYFINNQLSKTKIKKLEKHVVTVAEKSSKRERVAVEAERETDDLKKAEYMADRINEVYEGIISSVMHFGFFVELDNTIEGLVRVSDLVDDYYIYDSENYCFRGESTNKTYKIGDVAKIRVAKADVSKREIDFELVKEEEEELV